MKFTIRDVLLVTMIVALALGWVLDRVRLVAENDRLIDRLDRIQGGRSIGGTTGGGIRVLPGPEPKPRGSRFFTRRELGDQTLDSP